MSTQPGDLAVRHSTRFRKVSTLYPRLVAEAYDGDIASAVADPDDVVAAKVNAWEIAHGIPARDWQTVGETERDPADAHDLLTDEDLRHAIADLVRSTGTEGITEEALADGVDALREYGIAAAVWDLWKAGSVRIAWDHEEHELRWIGAP